MNSSMACSRLAYRLISSAWLNASTLDIHFCNDDDHYRVHLKNNCSGNTKVAIDSVSRLDYLS